MNLQVDGMHKLWCMTTQFTSMLIRASHEANMWTITQVHYSDILCRAAMMDSIDKYMHIVHSIIQAQVNILHRPG